MKLKFVILGLLTLISSTLIAQVSKAPLQNLISAGGGTGTVHTSTTIPSYFASVGQPAVYARPVSTSNGGGVMTANELMFGVSDPSPPVITDNTSATVNSGGDITITATITDPESTISAASVSYRSIVIGGSLLSKALVASGSTYSVQIPAAEIGELGVVYKLSATSGGGVTLPMPALN